MEDLSSSADSGALLLLASIAQVVVVPWVATGKGRSRALWTVFAVSWVIALVLVALVPFVSFPFLLPGPLPLLVLFAPLVTVLVAPRGEAPSRRSSRRGNEENPLGSDEPRSTE